MPATPPQEPGRMFQADRIGRNLLFTTAMVRSEVSSGVTSTGTGFFYDAYLGETTGVSIPMLVTNKHVLAGGRSGSFRCILTEDGAPRLGESVEINFRDTDWVGHPDPDVDVAAVAVASAFAPLQAQGRSVFFRQVGRDLLPSPSVIEDLDVVEPVMFVGYPASLFDTANLTPIIRRGTTATPVQLDYCGAPQFLIDGSVFPGSSGSPVFIVNENGYRQGNSIIMGSPRIIFLGVLAAVHLHPDSGRIVTAAGPQVQFNQLVDLGLVYKWTAVDETVAEYCRLRGIDRSSARTTTPIDL